MEFTVVMGKKHEGGGISTVEIIKDSNHCLGRCRGIGNYVVRRPDRKHYRMRSFIDEYTFYKSSGYKVVRIDVN